jgi:hypothetical protein
MSTPAELAAQAQLEAAVEWGTYLAHGPINIDGARAFNAGDRVPKSHVERGLVDTAQVSKTPDPPKVTKAAVAEAAAHIPTSALPNVTGA